MIALGFLILPFTYFYAEETLESDGDMFDFDSNSDDEETTASVRKRTRLSSLD